MKEKLANAQFYTATHMIGITMGNKYKKSGKTVKTNRLHGNKLNNVSVNQ